MSVPDSANLLNPVRRRDRPRLATAVFFVMCMIVLIGAFASRNNLLYWVVGMAIGSVLVHGFTAGPPMMRVFLSGVELPESIERGMVSAARVTLVSRNRWRAARAMRVEVVLVGPSGRRLVGRAGVIALAPGQHLPVQVGLDPAVRGIYDLESVRVSTTFPFGLSTKELEFKPEGRVVCVPNESLLSASDERRVRQQALRFAADVQPAEIREYLPGDPRRLIAWRASARARRLQVRDLESQRGRRLWLRCHATSDALLDREEQAERMLDRAASLGRHASRLNLQIGVLHEPSGMRVLGQGGQQWRVALAEIGDAGGVVLGPAPKPDDFVIDLHPESAAREAIDV